MIAKLKPVFKDYLWGGKRLVEEYQKDFQGEILAESWELSCHPDGECQIDSGTHKGTRLVEYLETHPEVLGTNCMRYDTFPILIKLIDAKQNLSIQVHPDDNYAKEYEGDNGKNEMWYIVDATEEAFIYFGFNQEISKTEYEKRIAENQLLEVLNKVKVEKGDCFFIKAGTVHAIGAGCLIAEVQQSSNVTYRVYDFGRRDMNGNLRELHIDKAVEVSILEPSVNTANTTNKLVESKYFTVEELNITSSRNFIADHASFQSLLILSGSGTLHYNGEVIALEKANSIFIGANSGTYTVEGDFKALLTYIDNN